MIKRLSVAIVFAVAAALATPVMAQTAATNMELLRQKVKADKKLVVAQNLNLTDAEGAVFWPVYDIYQRELQQINQRLTTFVLAYAEAYKKGPIENDVAKKLLAESMAIDQAEAALTSAAVPRILEVLPTAKAVRYIQIENKIRAVVRYELATSIPLVP